MDNGKGWIDGGPRCKECRFESYQFVAGYGVGNNARIYVRTKGYVMERKAEIKNQIKTLEEEFESLKGEKK